jgi:hypothetical protein
VTLDDLKMLGAHDCLFGPGKSAHE